MAEVAYRPLLPSTCSGRGVNPAATTEWFVTHVQAAQRSDLVSLDVFFRWCSGEESCWVVRAFRVPEDRMLTSPKPGLEIRPNK